MRSTDAADHLERVAKESLGNPRIPVAPAQMLKALVRFRLPQGPSSKDPTLLLAVGDLFTLDGDEPVSVEGLIREGLAEIANLT